MRPKQFEEVDWNEVAAYQAANHTYEECKTKFGFSRAAWREAKSKSLVRSGFRLLTSNLTLVDPDTLRKIAKASRTYTDIMRKLGMTVKGANHQLLKDRLASAGINFISIPNTGGHKIKELSSYLTKDSNAASNFIKPKLIEAGLLENECSMCGLGPEWNNVRLNLQLDHKDGDCRNNILSNLRIVCPNCHSQTESFAGRNRKTTKVPLDQIVDREYIELPPYTGPDEPYRKFPAADCRVCGKPTSTGEMFCSKVCLGVTRRKVDLTTEQIVKMIDANGGNRSKTAREIGISEAAVRKRLKKLDNHKDDRSKSLV